MIWPFPSREATRCADRSSGAISKTSPIAVTLVIAPRDVKPTGRQLQIVTYTGGRNWEAGTPPSPRNIAWVASGVER